MKKMVFVIILILIIMSFTMAFASIEQNERITYPDFTSKTAEWLIRTFDLPASLEVIGEEAFEGTSITHIKLPEAVSTIKERAFANISTLRSIEIPLSTTEIAKTVFIGSNNVTISAAPSSYARTWAMENRLPFFPIVIMHAKTDSQDVVRILKSITMEALDTVASMTQKTDRIWRKIVNIQVHDTIEIIANHVQGRSPPIC